jgi:large subunit ribosomal protein L21
MANAVFRSGGKQFRVAEGDTVLVDKLAGEPGDEVVFEDVLLIGGETAKIGRPTVGGAQVKGQILSQGHHDKLAVFKFKRRKKHRKLAGHRQAYTQVKITGITG